MTRTSPEVAVLIVTHQSVEFVAECAIAALATGAEVVVIDNASTDGTVASASIPGVRVIANKENRGFATAINQGVQATKTPYLLMLNPDAILQTGIRSLVEACENPRTGAAGGQLVDRAGVPQRGFVVRHFPSATSLSFEALMINRLWPRNPVNWHYRCLGLDLTKPALVDQPAGAFFLFRRGVWESVGGLDEGYFPIWFEDVDFCGRIQRAGYNIEYRPDAVARHSGAHSAVQVPVGDRAVYWYRSLLRYATFHFGVVGRVVTCLSVIAGTVLRVCCGGSSQRSREMLRSYKQVVRMAARSLVVNTAERQNIGIVR